MNRKIGKYPAGVCPALSGILRDMESTHISLKGCVSFYINSNNVFSNLFKLFGLDIEVGFTGCLEFKMSRKGSDAYP
jgi:hypothetical protein